MALTSKTNGSEGGPGGAGLGVAASWAAVAGVSAAGAAVVGGSVACEVLGGGSGVVVVVGGVVVVVVGGAVPSGARDALVDVSALVVGAAAGAVAAAGSALVATGLEPAQAVNVPIAANPTIAQRTKKLGVRAPGTVTRPSVEQGLAT